MARVAAKGVKQHKNVEKVDILPGDEVWVVSSGKRLKLPEIDTIVLASERRPNVFLAEVAERRKIEVKIVGDAAGISEWEQGTVMAAIATGYDAGRQI
jgi:hypothetical protein